MDLIQHNQYEKYQWWKLTKYRLHLLKYCSLLVISFSATLYFYCPTFIYLVLVTVGYWLLSRFRFINIKYNQQLTTNFSEVGEDFQLFELFSSRLWIWGAQFEQRVDWLFYALRMNEFRQVSTTTTNVLF